MDGGHPSGFIAPSQNLQQLFLREIELCEYNYILPALFSTILGAAIYLCNENWRNVTTREVKFYETSGFMIGLVVLCPTILCVCRVLYRACSEKHFTPVLVFVVSLGLILCLITGIHWKFYSIVSNNDSEKELPLDNQTHSNQEKP